jgi:CheY-like chemotaxis protein
MRDVRFLVVDDSAMARKLVASVIRARLGSERILHASDGKEAILALQERPIDIIISDWNMNEVHGDELLAYVRRDDRLKAIPFLMVTSNNRREFILSALQLGVTHYLVKPFTPAELEQKIRNSWNAASKRQSERHADLPAHQLEVRVEGQPYHGALLDLSRSGALLRMQYSAAVGLFKCYELSLVFTDANSGRRWAIPNLVGNAVRLQAEGTGMCLIGLKFDEASVAPEAAQTFAELLEWLTAREPQVISN